MKSYKTGHLYFLQIIRNWVHQGILYMDRGERGLRLISEVFFVFVLTVLVSFTNAPIFLAFSLSVLLIHTLYWTLNGNFWALMQFSIPSLGGHEEHRTLAYIQGLQSRASAFDAIEGLALFGSVTRGAWHRLSDLDTRYLRKPGLYNLIRAFIFVTVERGRAAFLRQPLDVFLADDVDFLEKLRKDEKPVFLVKRNSILEMRFPDNGPQCLVRLSLIP